MAGGLGEGIALIIAAATVFGFIAKKTGQPTVIAYIVAGMSLGPVGLNLVGETEFTRIISELGLVFLLFLIGLEIRLEDIREIMKPTLLVAVSQMALTFSLGYTVVYLLGFSVIESVLIGLAGMFSSTALVVKMLTDRDEGASLPERLDIGILLVQDVAVILILAFLTVNFSNISEVALRSAEILGMMALIAGISFASSRYILPRLFREISDNSHAFFVHGLAWAFLFISLAQELNLSMEIGAFFAGLSLAQLPYSRELQERVRPLTDLFMAMFFINFGLKLVPGNLSSLILQAVILSAVLVVGKFVILFGLIDRMKFTPETSFKASLNMVQVSEFGLILAGLGVSEGIVGQQVLGLVSLTAVLTMSVSSYLISFNSRIYSRIEKQLEVLESGDKKDVETGKLENHAVVVGYDEMTRHLIEALEERFDQVLVVDKDPDNVDELSRSDHEFLYGDLRHAELRKAACLETAEIVISVAPDFQLNREILEFTDKDTTFFLKADTMKQAGELYEMGAHFVILRDVLTGERTSEYLKLYLEDRELFLEEIENDRNRILYGGKDE